MPIKNGKRWLADESACVVLLARHVIQSHAREGVSTEDTRTGESIYKVYTQEREYSPKLLRNGGIVEERNQPSLWRNEPSPLLHNLDPMI